MSLLRIEQAEEQQETRTKQEEGEQKELVVRVKARTAVTGRRGTRRSGPGHSSPEWAGSVASFTGENNCCDWSMEVV